MFIPLGVSEDTGVEMQYYDSNGDLLLHTKYNMHMGNSYWNFPTANKTLTDLNKGALGRRMKEITKYSMNSNQLIVLIIALSIFGKYFR